MTRRSALTITAVPFQSSRLSIPPSPSSPKSPLTLPLVRYIGVGNAVDVKAPDVAPPAEPLPWVWQCHVCKRVYRLTTTNRCVEDGHRFCSGTTVTKRSRITGKKVIKHKACASEFDYAGWQRYGDWRRTIATHEAEPSDRNCWLNCHYPSQCRWKIVMAGSGGAASSQSSAADRVDYESSSPTAVIIIELDEKADVAESGQAPVDANASSPTEAEIERSERRRKRLSDGQTHSPLASSPDAAGGDVATEWTAINLRPATFAEFEEDLKDKLAGLEAAFGSSGR